ncbi:Serine/threonine protein phosphatase 2A 55 kDa regulatory subunit B alpha isoform [Striga hermonthica]|uniref:Serine/threonine protein phosphatase 2A 55 kDa regulatory subunit B alpha isoform n=1 Tax=Striga hermonthica TaxID=68872 RepID=A0A9N7NDF6_STRHE|nr:Serine/threonine protein phosphatase 2A 55 kDa regulatory subunit B alpha isoform [Striga hermonthica]
MIHKSYLFKVRIRANRRKFGDGDAAFSVVRMIGDENLVSKYSQWVTDKEESNFLTLLQKEEAKGKDIDELTSRHELERLDGALLKHPTYQYKTEFQSHEPDFDSLRSIEIEEKINKIRWCASSNGSLCLLSANDKTIKLWRVKDHEAKQVTEMEIGQSVSSENSLLAEKSFINGKTANASDSNSLELTENMLNGVSYNGANKKIAYLEDATRARCRRVYAHAHDFNINSISVNRYG